MSSFTQGVRIGDVGIVTEDGIFDFIFNVCPSQNPLINPSELPDDFEALERPEIRVMEQHFKMQTHLFNNAVNRIEEPSVSTFNSNACLDNFVETSDINV